MVRMAIPNSRKVRITSQVTEPAVRVVHEVGLPAEAEMSHCMSEQRVFSCTGFHTCGQSMPLVHMGKPAKTPPTQRMVGVEE